MNAQMKAILIFISSFFCTTHSAFQTVSVIGTGYVGLVTGACLSELHAPEQFRFICLDVDIHKIEKLNKGILPIYEPGLDAIVSNNVKRGILQFSTDIDYWLAQSDIVFVAVGTPTREDGEVDMSYIHIALQSIANNMHNKATTIVIKSTVPIGTTKKIPAFLTSKGISSDQYAVVSNPEFLREGTAVQDFISPDRIVCGIDSEIGEEHMRKLYQPLIDKNIPFIVTDTTSSETVKYVSNCFLALKLSYINEIANLCDITGANIKTVSLAVGLDKRINPHFLNPGPGYGGSCLPKDTVGFLRTAHELGVPLYTIDAAHRANQKQKLVPYKKLKKLLNNNLSNKTVGILGLAFKENTDDIRYAASISIIKKLLAKNVTIKVHDPAAMANVKTIFPNIIYCKNAYVASEGANALIILTGWDEYVNLDYKRIKELMSGNIVIDSRNILDPLKISSLDFLYIGYGISSL